MSERGEKICNKPRVYLAGQWNEHDNDWKKGFDGLSKAFDFHDPERDSDQTSPDTYFPDDVNGVISSDIMVANPGIAPSESTWAEIGIFYAAHAEEIGKRCNKLIIVWREDRNPKWSKDFIDKMGIVVSSVGEARAELEKLM